VVYVWTRFGIFVARRVGNPERSHLPMHSAPFQGLQLTETFLPSMESCSVLAPVTRAASWWPSDYYLAP